jgi:RNA polymerase sigma-70 factor (ECF subfamily)
MGRAGGAHDRSSYDEDTRLLVAARTDPLAFKTLFHRNFSKVLSYFYARTRCTHTSADLAAETFAQLFTTRRRFDPEAGPAEAWLIGIARNLFRHWARRAAVDDRGRRRIELAMPVVSEDDLEHIVEMIDLSTMRNDLNEALSGLSDAHREAVLLRVGLDLPYDEVAARLGCTVGAARVRVSRGMDYLLDQLGQT